MRFHRCTEAEAKHDDSIAFPIYAVVFTKLKKIKGVPMVIEIIHHQLPVIIIY